MQLIIKSTVNQIHAQAIEISIATFALMKITCVTDLIKPFPGS